MLLLPSRVSVPTKCLTVPHGVAGDTLLRRYYTKLYVLCHSTVTHLLWGPPRSDVPWHVMRKLAERQQQGEWMARNTSHF
jgi:hypothetical protein